MQIQVCDIVKTFGEKTAVDYVSFTARSGRVFGLLGRNGAGKTTTMRIMVDVFKADSGDVLIDGKKIDRRIIKFGYLPEERGLYPKMTIKTQLLYLAELNGIGRYDAMEAILKWLKRLNMEDCLNKKLNTLSKGNQQKIQLASVLMTNPDIIILDEPFSGLDPVNADVLKSIIQEMVEEDKVVIFSSHQMNSIEEICTEIVIMDEGKAVISGNLNDIKNRYPKTHINITGKDIKSIKNSISHLKGSVVSDVSLGDISLDIHLNNADDRNKILDIISDNDYEIDSFSIVKPTLNEIFIDAVSEVRS